MKPKRYRVTKDFPHARKGKELQRLENGNWGVIDNTVLGKLASIQFNALFNPKKYPEYFEPIEEEEKCSICKDKRVSEPGFRFCDPCGKRVKKRLLAASDLPEEEEDLSDLAKECGFKREAVKGTATFLPDEVEELDTILKIVQKEGNKLNETIRTLNSVIKYLKKQ